MSDSQDSRRTKTKAQTTDNKQAREEISRMLNRDERPGQRPNVPAQRSWDMDDIAPPTRQRRSQQLEPAPQRRPQQPEPAPQRPQSAPTEQTPPRQRTAALPTPPPARTDRLVRTAPEPLREVFEEADEIQPRMSPLAESRFMLSQAEQAFSSGWATSPRVRAPLYHETRSKPWLLIIIALVSIGVIALMFSPVQTSVGLFQQPGSNSTLDSVAQAVVPSGEHTLLRAPTLTAAQIDSVLSSYGSPAAGTGNDWVALGQQYGIDPAYALAFFVVESTAGTAQGWAGWKPDGSSTHNIGNIICAGYATCFGRFRDYPSWQAGIEDWYRLISVEYIQGRGLQTVEQIIPIYAPAFENDVDAYVNNVERMVAEWRTK